MIESTWWEYVREVAGEAQLKDIADRVGIDKSNVTRWKNGGRPAADFAVSFARAYGRPVTEALVASSFISQSEAMLRTVKVGVEDLSDSDLAAELLRRAQAREAESRPMLRAVAHTKPKLDAIDGDEGADRDAWD